MKTYYCYPSVVREEFNKSHGGIRGSLEAHTELLPEFGWHEVHDEHEADLVVGYLGIKSERLDVFHLRGLYPTAEIEYHDRYWGYNAKIIKNIRRARHVVCVSEWLADILRRDMHLNPHVVPGHGLNLEYWDMIEPWQHPTGKPYALWNKTRTYGVCDPTPVAILAERFPDYQFVTTFLPRELHEIPPNVTVTGLLPYEEAWRYVKGAAIYLATTRETFGRGTLEALASDCAIIGFDWGATSDVIGNCGILVTPGDYDALAAAFEDALAGKSGGRDRIAKHFRWKDIVRQTADIYDLALLDRLEVVSPRVSVIIPNHNYSQYVSHAIQSVIEQAYQDWELIVVDDGSTDDSVKVIEEAIADEPRARLVSQQNMGVAYARNRGISEAKGEFISCLDADDAIAPSYLETLVPAIAADQKLGIVYTGIRLMGHQGRLSQCLHTWPGPYDESRGMDGNQVPTCCLFRRSWWERLGGYRQRYAPHGAGQEDADFWFRILANGGGAEMVTPEGLFYYRTHGDQMTKRHRGDWSKNMYYFWHPFVRDGQHPFASQLGRPSKGSWAVRNYDVPDVSIIVPVGPGHGQYLIDSLDSVEAQSYRNWELIVVNDTGAPLDLTPWPYAKLVETGGNRGAGYARNRGTEAANAPLITYLDADDYLQPDFLEHTLSVYDGRWVYTDLFICRTDDTMEKYRWPDWDVSTLWRRGIAAVTCLYSKEMWEAVGGFDEELMREDWDFHLKLAWAGYCGVHVPEFLFTYRHNTGTRRSEGSKRKEIHLLHERYDREELMARCKSCGGGKRPVRRKLRPVLHSQRVGDDQTGWIEFEFIGKNKHTLTYRGANTYYPYRAGNNRHHKFVRVHPDDAPKIESLAVFRRSSRGSDVLIATPIRGNDIADDNGNLPDITAMTIAEMREYDFTGHDIDALIAVEESGKNRIVALAYLRKLKRRRERAAMEI